MSARRLVDGQVFTESGPRGLRVVRVKVVRKCSTSGYPSVWPDILTIPIRPVFVTGEQGDDGAEQQELDDVRCACGHFVEAFVSATNSQCFEPREVDVHASKVSKTTLTASIRVLRISMAGASWSA